MNLKKLATHVSKDIYGKIARYYCVKDGSIARFSVKDDKWVMAGNWVSLNSLIPIGEA